MDAILISGDAECGGISLSTAYTFARIHLPLYLGPNQQCHRLPMATLVPLAVPMVKQGSHFADGQLPQSAHSGGFWNWVLAAKGREV